MIFFCGSWYPLLRSAREHARPRLVAGVVGHAGEVEAGQAHREVDLDLDAPRARARDGRALQG